MSWRAGSRWLLILALATAVSACGFHLRGGGQIADQYRPLTIDNVQADAQLSILLNDALLRAGASPDGANDGNRLRVSVRREKDRWLSRSDASDIRLKLLVATLQFSIDDPSGKTLRPQETITNSRTVELDSENVLSHARVLRDARREQDRALVRGLIYRLRK